METPVEQTYRIDDWPDAPYLSALFVATIWAATETLFAQPWAPNSYVEVAQ